MTGTVPPLLRITEMTKRFPGTLALDNVDLVVERRHDPRPGRRERRRQVDAAQGARGRLPPHVRPHRDRRRRGRRVDTTARARARHRHRLPGAEPAGEPLRRTQHLARRRADERARDRRARCRAGRHACARADGRLHHRPGAEGGEDPALRASARRDRKGAHAATAAAPHLRRADRRSRPGRRRPPLPHRRGPARRGCGDHLRQPPLQGGTAHLRPRDRAQERPRRRRAPVCRDVGGAARGAHARPEGRGRVPSRMAQRCSPGSRCSSSQACTWVRGSGAST
jgi:ABC-type sugar transport system, ATPase component